MHRTCPCTVDRLTFGLLLQTCLDEIKWQAEEEAGTTGLTPTSKRARTQLKTLQARLGFAEKGELHQSEGNGACDLRSPACYQDCILLQCRQDEVRECKEEVRLISIHRVYTKHRGGSRYQSREVKLIRCTSSAVLRR